MWFASTPPRREPLPESAPQFWNRFGGGIKSPGKPPRIIKNRKKLVRIYQVNHQWKSVTVKLLVSIYLFICARALFITCDPWWTYFRYLTVWQWTIIQLYFLYTLYLDIHARLARPVSPVALRPEAGGSRWRMLSGGLLGFGDTAETPARTSTSSDTTSKDRVFQIEPVSEVARVVAQAISELAFALAVLVTLLFWVVVYPQEPWRPITWEINMHGMGLIIMSLDYLYRFAGFNLRNLRILYAFGAIYAFMHISSVLHTGDVIYPGLDFRSAYSYFIFFVGISILIATHKALYLLHHWSYIREEWKSAIGISAFFLIPRRQSQEVLDDSSFEEEVRAREIIATRGIASRFRLFLRKEVLSSQPSLHARASLKLD